MYKNLRAFFLLPLFLIVSCSSPGVNHWSEMVPESALFIIVPESDATLSSTLDAHYMATFDDITPSAIQLVSNIRDYGYDLPVEALLLYPDTSNDWQPVWITKKREGLVNQLKSQYQRAFEQNRYRFNQFTIEKLFFTDRIIYIFEAGDYIVFSESSLGIENMIRTLNGEEDRAQLEKSEIHNESVIINFPSMDIWVRQMAQVTHRPFLYDIFKGSSPTSFTFNGTSADNWSWQMSGIMKLEDDPSSLLKFISHTPQNFVLDRFIPVNAAAFSIFRSDPREPISSELVLNHETDLFLEQNWIAVERIQNSLANEVAFVTFAESGPASTSEFIYIRSLKNSEPIKEILDDLDQRNLIVKDENTYAINSTIIGKLIGTHLNPAENYYLTIYDRVAVLAHRKGLAESIGGDAERRRVMYYDEDYSRVYQSLGGSLSSIFYMDAPRFSRFVQPWLYPQNYLGVISANLDEFVIGTRVQSGGTELEVTISNFERERTDRPFRDQWVFPIGGADITGVPVFADITGSMRDEVIFTTDYGTVYALATDGTSVIQMSTNDDQPIGSPVVYDWYGNNQNVIMQAAGDKVYAWNQNGELLPNFPVILNEEISTPLSIMDFTGNGVAEMVLATADRNVHVLNARGLPVNGWPQNTNSVVHHKPLVASLQGSQSLFVFAENALHAWNLNGQRRTGYPKFLPAQIDGAPVVYGDHLLGSGRDGNLYSIGTTPLFSDTLSTTHRQDSLLVQSISVSNSSLNSTPVIQSIMYRDESTAELIRNDLILVQSVNGSLFLYDDHGQLVFTQALGQPASGLHPPAIVDINSDRRQDLVAIADFGRLYAWDILSGERHQDLPTTGMNYPVILDYFGDGHKEIIAHTRNGIQCWTIYFTRRESLSE